VRRTGSTASVNSTQVTASCLAGERAIYGESVWSGNTANAELYNTHAFFSGNPPTSYSARGANDDGTNRVFTVTVGCLQG
jgi:hypothetical protein